MRFEYRSYRSCKSLLLTAAAFAFVANGQETSARADAVEVSVVKHVEMGEAIKKLKGKVVVVDFWSLG